MICRSTYLPFLISLSFGGQKVEKIFFLNWGKWVWLLFFKITCLVTLCMLRWYDLDNSTSDSTISKTQCLCRLENAFEHRWPSSRISRVSRVQLVHTLFCFDDWVGFSCNIFPIFAINILTYFFWWIHIALYKPSQDAARALPAHLAHDTEG